MNKPNNLYKTTGNGEPLDQCPTLLEYILKLTELIERAKFGMEMCHYESVIQRICDLEELIQEMAEGNWLIEIKDKK